MKLKRAARSGQQLPLLSYKVWDITASLSLLFPLPRRRSSLPVSGTLSPIHTGHRTLFYLNPPYVNMRGDLPNPETPTKPPKPRRVRKKTNNNNGDQIQTEMSETTKKLCQRKNPRDYPDKNSIARSRKIRRVNGIIMCNWKPSFCLGRGVGSCLRYQGGGGFRIQYKRMLIRVLKKLIRRHNWVEAAGVLAVLLKATTRDKSSRLNRYKYWATMEIMKHIKGDSINMRKLRNIYDLWIKKVGLMTTRSVKERFAIQCEYIIFCLRDGGLENAHQNALGLMQERGFQTAPIANLVVGLTFYELWYSALPEEWRLKNLNYTIGSTLSETHEARLNSDWYTAVESQEDHFSVEVNSDTSVANVKKNNEVGSTQERVPMDVDVNQISDTSVANDTEKTDVDSAQESVNMDLDVNLKTQSPQQIVLHDNLKSQSQEILLHDDSFVYSVEGSEHKRFSSPYDSVSIFQTPGLPTWLLPLQMPPINDDLEDVIYAHKELLNDHYRTAVEHLQVALHFIPPMSEALLPLIQLLMSGDRVNEALSEIDNFVDDSPSLLKLRLKVVILEHFYRGNHQLTPCYEEILKIDSTCSYSLVKLINMHQRGDYSTEKLMKMIVLHLDVTYPEFHIWKDLAYCLIKLSQCAGDQMSTRFNGNEEEINQSYTGQSNQIPDLFIHGESGETWMLHCKRWLSRHFSPRMLASDIAAGELKLLTYKAGVAAFLYGPDFEYVTKASEILENGSTNQDLYSVLRTHVRNSVGIYKVRIG